MKKLNLFKYAAIFAAFCVLFVAGCGFFDDDDDDDDGAGNNGGTVGNDNRNNNPIDIPVILEGVKFQSGKAILDTVSYAYLDGVIKSLRNYPEMKFEIQGHTDNVGKRDSNMALSKNRANTVKEYFVQNGLMADQFRAVGYGPDVPIASNDTELNRRIELRRMFW